MGKQTQVSKTQISGVEKTAILMNVLGEKRSFELMKEMADTDLRRLLNVMGSMKKSPISLINSVLEEFTYKLSEQEEVIFDEDIAHPDVVKKGLGEERAKTLFGGIKNMNLVTRQSLAILDQVEAKVLAEFLSGEHPQTIALILAHVGLEKQMTIVRMLNDATRTEVIMRMANLDHVDPKKISELDEFLRHELGEKSRGKSDQLGGVLATADLINGMDKKMMNSIMTSIGDKDPLLTEEIRQHMFTFSDIIKVDDRGIQMILREVPNDQLLLALKSASQEVKEKLMGAMSERASEILLEDLAALGPQKVSSIESAQRTVVAIVKRLEEEGKVVIGVGEESEIVP